MKIIFTHKTYKPLSSLLQLSIGHVLTHTELGDEYMMIKVNGDRYLLDLCTCDAVLAVTVTRQDGWREHESTLTIEV